MHYKKFGTAAIFLLLLAMSSYGQEVVVTLRPDDGTPATYVNAQIVADTLAAGGLGTNRVYELQRDQYYFHNAIFTVPNGKTLHLRAQAGAGKKPIIFLWETGVAPNPTRPPGNFVVLNGGNLIIENICIAGFYEPEPNRVNTVQGGLINTTAVGSSIVLDGVVFSNINGQHVRTGNDSRKVQVINSIFANMGALSTSNLGAGKGIDLREAACDSFIIVNNTFVNYQDRAIRHYNFSNPSAGTGEIKYGRIEHNTFVNGMGFHGLFSLGNVGPEIIITNNLFVDAFALGEDSTDATRAAEWANTGEVYPNGKNRITWIFTAPNNTTQWTVRNNYYAISDSGYAFLNDFGYPVGSPLSYHINSRLGADSVNAFTQTTLALGNIPRLMTNMMRWYEDPNGGHRAKDQTNFVLARDDYDRRPIEYYRDELNASYPTASVAYTGAEGGFPVGDLNWFPDKKAQWEQGIPQFTINVDGNKDAFYETLTGPNDGYLQIKYYGGNDNGNPYNNADLSAKVWTAWDKDWFYLYEEVRDDTLAANHPSNVWEEDCLELKFDAQPKDSVRNSVWDTRLTALGLATPGVLQQDSLNNVAVANKQWARKIIPGGYALELALRWSAIGHNNPETNESVSVAVDSVFGLAIGQHDNDGRARRQASVEWAAVMLDAVWNTPKYHGTVKFLPDNKLQFIPRNNVTKRSNPIPYDGTPFFVAVDGTKDRVYNALRGPNDGYLQIRAYANNDNGRPVNDADLSARVWTAWDDTWFYLYEEVRDDTLAANHPSNVWEEDCLELKFDAQPKDSVRNSVWDTRLTALGLATAGVLQQDSLNNVAVANKQWARKVISGGYALELAIKWSAIGHTSPETNESVRVAVDSVFGMAILNHDNDGRARRQASVEWAAFMRDAVWNTPKYHGTVKFLADNKLQFIARNNVTGRTNIIPYDGSNYTPPTAVEEKDIAELPLEFSLSQNYPNPFNPATQIRYSLKEGVRVSLQIYNVMGNLVTTLVDQKQSPGNYSVLWDGRDRQGKLVSTGIYFYKIQAGSFTQIRKMVLVK